MDSFNYFVMWWIKVNTGCIAEAYLEGARRALEPSSPARFFFFCNHLIFCDHLEGLQTVFIEVKLIINHAPLTYVYPNTVKTYLTPNHMLFRRQLLCYPNTKSTLIRNLTVLSSSTDKINSFSYHFWPRCKHEYVVNLHETNGNQNWILTPKNYVVVVYDENVPRHFWRIGTVTQVLLSRDFDTKRSDSEIWKDKCNPQTSFN